MTTRLSRQRSDRDTRSRLTHVASSRHARADPRPPAQWTENGRRVRKSEKAENVFVVLGDFGWSDLGTWKSLYDVEEKDKNNSVLDGKIKMYDSKNCIVKTPKERLVVLEGLDGYIVAEYDNVLMVCRMDNEQQVKKFVADIKADKKEEFY